MILEVFEVLLLAFTIFAESSGEPFSGKVAVGNVIKNRSEHWNKSYSEVIFKQKQFSCYNNASSIIKHIKRLEEKPFKQCLEVAAGIYYDYIPDNTHGALYYTRKEIERVWMAELSNTLIIGDHKFMKRFDL